MPCPFSILLGSLNDAILIVATSPVERLVTIQRTTSADKTSSSSLMESVWNGLSSSLIVTVPNLIHNQGFFSLWNGTAARIWANAIASAVAGWCSSKTQSLLSSPSLNISKNLQPILMYLGTVLPPSLLMYPLLHASVMLSIETPQYGGIDDYFRNVTTFKQLYDGFLPMFIGTTQQYLLMSTLQTWWSTYKERRQTQQKKEASQPPLSSKFVDIVEQAAIATIVGAAAEPWFYTSYQQMVSGGTATESFMTITTASASFPVSFSAIGVRMIKIVIEQSLQHSDLFDYVRKAILAVAGYFH